MRRFGAVGAFLVASAFVVAVVMVLGNLGCFEPVFATAEAQTPVTPQSCTSWVSYPNQVDTAQTAIPTALPAPAAPTPADNVGSGTLAPNTQFCYKAAAIKILTNGKLASNAYAGLSGTAYVETTASAEACVTTSNNGSSNHAINITVTTSTRGDGVIIYGRTTGAENTFICLNTTNGTIGPFVCDTGAQVTAQSPQAANQSITYARRWIQVCYAADSATSTGVLACLPNGVGPPAPAQGTIGDKLKIGDCMLYPSAQNTNFPQIVICVGSAAGINATSDECL